MTVASTNSKAGPYAGAGTTGPFAVDFRFLEDSHLQVIRTSAAGVATTLTLTTDYTVTGAGGTSGEVTLVAALAVGETLTVLRSVPATQETDYVQNDAFPAESHERALDKLTMIAQQQSEILSRAITVPTGESSVPSLPSAADRANTLLGFDANGDPVVTLPNPTDATAVSLALQEFIADIGSTADAALGAGIPGFDYALNYAVRTVGQAIKDNYINLMWLVTSSAERTAILDYTSTTDHTALINAALAYGKRVYAPAGRWNVDTDVGVVLPTGFAVVGDGLRTMFVAASKGATLAELQAYTKGSVFKRAFTTGVANPYVMGGYLADFSVILTPQTPYNAANYQQIGVDLRNITRSVVERVYVGNNPDAQSHPWFARSLSGADQTQGYGFVVGTRTGPPDYCGGEKNTLRDCMAWGLFKGITIDDSALSPQSSAHQTTVDTCDVQGAHELITQGTQYNAGTVIKNVTIQSNRRQTGNANPTVGVSLAGYNCSAHVAYAEMGAACDVLLALASTAKRCKGELLYYSSSSPSTATIVDNGTGNKNLLVYPAPVTTGSTTTGEGDITEMFNKGYRRGRAKATIAAGVVTMVESVGEATISVVTNPGRLRLTLAKPMPTANWHCTVTVEFAGRAAGGYTAIYASQSAGQFDIDTFTLSGGVVTVANPTTVSFEFYQR